MPGHRGSSGELPSQAHSYGSRMLLALDLGKLLWPVVVVALLVGVAVAAKVFAKKASAGAATSDDPWPYRVKPLLTQPEQVLLHRVRAALPDHLVFAQVQVARAFEVERRSDSLSWFNRIAQLSFDLLVCTPDSMPILAIELDDTSHGRQKQKDRDAKKDRVCRDAGLRLVRWNVRSLPTVESIRSEVVSQPQPVAVPGGLMPRIVSASE